MDMRSGIDRKGIDKSSLRDISGVSIDMTLPQQERIKSYVEQIVTWMAILWSQSDTPIQMSVYRIV